MTANTDQAAFWASASGQSWVEHQAIMDDVFAPVLDGMLARARLAPGMTVIDIGCGTGASVDAAAEIVGPQGHVTGFDISPVMLDHAKTRLAGRSNVTLIEGDAQTHPFEAASADALISRFGVMFFEDSVAAFSNMARALRPGAAMTLAAWGPAHENPWFMLPARIARDRLGDPPKVDRTLPGPFAFEDAARTAAMLEAAGLEVRIDTAPVTLNGGATPEAAGEISTRIGAAASVLRHFEGTEADRQAIAHGIAEAMSDWHDGHVRVPALIHFITAKAH